MPYLSFILAGRNDNYGGDQQQRIQTYIDQLAWLDQLYPDTFELVVCDWNPPTPKATMEAGFDWSQLENVTFLSVSPEIHYTYAGDANYPIMDYIARNVAIRHAQGEFVCVTNQDIYFSHVIYDFIAKKKLDPNYFYRADRCAFVPDFSKMNDPSQIEEFAQKAAFLLEYRPRIGVEKIESEIKPGDLPETWKGSSIREGGASISSSKLITEGDNDEVTAAVLESFHFLVRHQRVLRHQSYLAYGLHTNASGDFVIAAKKAFEDMHGFVETDQFYMHLDSYGIVQLRASGYKQAIFAPPNVVYHADHDRSGRAGRRETLSFEDHEIQWSKMLMAKISAKVNGPDWGLRDFDLPQMSLSFGERS